VDFVIHATVGALVGRALAPSDAEASAPWTRLGALAALLPDADHLLEWVSAEAYLVHHRSFSHSVLAACVAAAVAAAPRGLRKRRAGVVAVAYGSHLLLDVLTPFGTGLAWPFSGAMPALDGLFIIAPWLGLLCVIAALGAWWRGREGILRGRRAALVGLAAVLAFLLLELGVAGRAAGSVGAPVLATPGWKNPLTGVVFTLDGERLQQHRVGVDGVAVAVDSPARLSRKAPSVEVDRARAKALPLLARFRLPVARAGEGPGVVVFEDAQFWAWNPSRAPFTITVDLEADTVEVVEQVRGLQMILWLIVAGVVVLVTRGQSRPDRA
jgi:inner membrane protein